MDMLNTVFKNAKSRPAIIYIGGVDPTKYDTASGFNQYFRANADPNEAEIVPLSDIIDYQTEPDGRGYLNIEVKVRSKFSIPPNVFSNYNNFNSGSSLTYYIDTKGFSNNFSGGRNFASQPNITHFLLKGVESIPQQWNGFSGALPRILDFESALTLTSLSFHDYRTPNDRINVRNANDIDVSDYSSDNVFSNYNLNLVPEPLKVIYVHKDLETINNGGILDSLQTCINRNADVRFIDPSNVGLIVNTPINPQVSNFGATWVEFSFTNISNADFYEVWVKNFNGLIEQYFPIGEITNSNKKISGLDPNREYIFQLVARDVHYNDSIKSIATPQITTLAEDITTITETNVGGTYVEFDITNPSPYTINAVEVYVGGTLITDYQLDGLSVLMYNLIEQTSYNIEIIAKTDENIDLISNTINVTTTTTPTLFQNAVAYYKLDETSGDAIDVVNAYNGADVGTIVKDGEWYDYGTNESYVEIPNEDDFSFVDAQGDNTDFVVKTEVIFDGFNSQNRCALVSTFGDNVLGTDTLWALYYINNGLTFTIRDASNNDQRVDFAFSPVIGQKYILGATRIGNELKSFIDGVVVASITVNPNFQYVNGVSSLKLGNDTYTSDLNLVGRQKQTTIIKGAGWTDGEISDNYNNGNGTTI